MSPRPPSPAASRDAARQRTPLTRERVLRAAVALADEHGIDALSMRKLGDALGVKAMSLYNHVPNKDAILDGLVELVVAEIELPPPGTPWKSALRQRCQSAHAVLMVHPWAAALITGRVNVGPMMLRYIDWTIGTLRGAGFPLALADHAWNALDSHLYGFTLQALNFPFEANTYADVAASYLPSLDDEQYPHMAAMTREVAERRHDGISQLEFGLDLILDGLERALSLR